MPSCEAEHERYRRRPSALRLSGEGVPGTDLLPHDSPGNGDDGDVLVELVDLVELDLENLPELTFSLLGVRVSCSSFFPTRLPHVARPFFGVLGVAVVEADVVVDEVVVVVVVAAVVKAVVVVTEEDAVVVVAVEAAVVVVAAEEVVVVAVEEAAVVVIVVVADGREVLEVGRSSTLAGTAVTVW